MAAKSPCRPGNVQLQGWNEIRYLAMEMGRSCPSFGQAESVETMYFVLLILSS